MCLPMWKNAEPREGEMVGVLQIYRSKLLNTGGSLAFARVDETVGRLVALVSGPMLYQLTRANMITERNTRVADKTDAVREAGLKCLNICLNEPRSLSSCSAEMAELLAAMEDLARLSVCHRCSLMYLYPMFLCRP